MDYEKHIDLDLSSPANLTIANKEIFNGIKAGYQDFAIRLSTNKSAYPNTCAPVAGLLQYYRDSHNVDFEIDYGSASEDECYVKHTCCFSPLPANKLLDNKINNLSPFDRVWRFSSSEEVKVVVDLILKEMREQHELAQGVASGIEWCLNETMDNVLQHSNTEHGYVMAQVHKENKRLAICVFDAGIGIKNSFNTSIKHKPRTALDAITLALQERITRDESIGQGNGMWNLSQIVQANGGVYKVSSGGANYSFDKTPSTSERGSLYLGRKYGTTTIDFQLDFSQEVDIAAAFQNHRPTDLWLESLERDDGLHEIDVASLEYGTGTRKAAIRLRNTTLNIIRETKQRVILDFHGVTLTSSSFADELIGKIIRDYGFVFCITFIELSNLSKINQDIFDRSVEQRMAQIYYSTHIPEDD
ncbi:STAS-like domain-containing protein [Raoultibacter timonensis]|uniref:DUF4325 domain-containing protein n=1 Tax=Raoultibacter timonensis TaxID=1907662 RepID=A0ABM7WM08_9ACTN|nr:DUF4325 domain-containing protein [Raoultibacter timonensis]BDE97443.1 hypothetical protein CE91St30_27760 [Raoultibacter timonensis]BDF52046.1 hypothetical protein CE91St31_27760 [Raoultibacter timonensis]